MYTIVENKFHIVINLSEEGKVQSKKFLIKICALLTVSSMLIGVVFMSDFATAYSMAAANTVETPESSRMH